MGRAKITLHLTKYHATKPNPLLNQEAQHEDIWGSGGMA